MTSMLIVALLCAAIAGIFLKNAIHSLVLVGIVLGVFFVSCYAFDVSPRAILLDGMHEAQSMYHEHEHEI